MFSVIKTRGIWFALSGFLVIGSLILIFVWGLRPGIDFRGGSLAELEFEKPPSSSDITAELTAKGYDNVLVQPVDGNRFLIKTETLAGEELDDFKNVLTEKFGSFKELRFESVGATISRELVSRSYWQVILVCLGILCYIAYSFRKISTNVKRVQISSWRLGLAAVIALIHDITITIGAFAILGKFREVEIDTLFITALLTILGFSVHDTIVVFDRIRENLAVYSYKTLGSIIDYSINSTLARSINTSSTLIFVLIAMLLFGGETLFYFVLALLVGVTIGTYSSIFVASPLLYLFAKNR